ncbi:ABC transporter permease [Rhodanobacter sp. DHB23]|uniref:ABC transporter permease n=1 Tax=Rhodanobacter sp. DHB23 TaxID=2775923 RepID=UPI00177AC093|nr:ABC transporter permease [Rhodanobacter sp. DHB23]MBD8871545.1 ABC transporter permease [Rhodanobacter sp. DHB23]
MFDYYLRLALRRCRQNVPMVLLLVLTMAIGIAACMTAMTIFRALSGAPLPGVSPYLYVATMDAREEVDKDNPDYKQPDSLLKLVDARVLVDAHRAVQQVAVAQSLTLLGDMDGRKSEQAYGLMAYGLAVQALGVPLRYGRPWTEAELAANAPVLVIDTHVAQKLFGTEDAVGRSVMLGQRSFRVIGVSGEWKPRVQIFNLAENAGSVMGQEENFFVPAQAALDAGVGPLIAGECGKGAPVVSFQSAAVAQCRWMETWVRLDTPSQLADYGRFLAGYADAQHDAGRFAYPPQAKLYGTQAWMTLNRVVPDDVHLNLMLAGAFLLLCLVNVAGLLAARFLRRQGDVAIRRALGASRRDVFVQHLVETGLLGLIGGALALPLTWLGLWIVRMQPVSYAEAARFSPGVFVILFALSVGVGLLVGILPAWRVCRQPPALQIKIA